MAILSTERFALAIVAGQLSACTLHITRRGRLFLLAPTEIIQANFALSLADLVKKRCCSKLIGSFGGCGGRILPGGA